MYHLIVSNRTGMWQLKNTHNNTKILKECKPCPVLASYTLTFTLQLRKKLFAFPRQKWLRERASVTFMYIYIYIYIYFLSGSFSYRATCSKVPLYSLSTNVNFHGPDSAIIAGPRYCAV